MICCPRLYEAMFEFDANDPTPFKGEQRPGERFRGPRSRTTQQQKNPRKMQSTREVI
jgi:hypothetical protein